jgi:hypothetical protein
MKNKIPAVDYTNSKWTCTDPDNFQYGRRLCSGVYQFKEWIGGSKLEVPIDKFVKDCFDEPGSWEEDTIVLSNFNEQEIESHVSGYYGSLKELKETCGDDWEWIVAECIFEQQSGLY